MPREGRLALNIQTYKIGSIKTKEKKVSQFQIHKDSIRFKFSLLIAMETDDSTRQKHEKITAATENKKMERLFKGSFSKRQLKIAKLAIIVDVEVGRKSLL